MAQGVAMGGAIPAVFTAFGAGVGAAAAAAAGAGTDDAGTAGAEKVRPRLVWMQRRLVRVQLQPVRTRLGAGLQLMRELRLAPRWALLASLGRGPTVVASASAEAGDTAVIRSTIPAVVRTRASKDSSYGFFLRSSVKQGRSVRVVIPVLFNVVMLSSLRQSSR